MSYRILDIEGIGPAYSEKLAAAGITSSGQLLQNCATPKSRQTLAAKTGLSEVLILKWANLSDLMRVKGVATQYSELLEAAGVDTVKELRHRTAPSLAQKMAEVNAAKKLARRPPTAGEVEKWIAHAKTLDPVLVY